MVEEEEKKVEKDIVELGKEVKEEEDDSLRIFSPRFSLSRFSASRGQREKRALEMNAYSPSPHPFHPPPLLLFHLLLLLLLVHLFLRRRLPPTV